MTMKPNGWKTTKTYSMEFTANGMKKDNFCPKVIIIKANNMVFLGCGILMGNLNSKLAIFITNLMEYSTDGISMGNFCMSIITIKADNMAFSGGGILMANLDPNLIIFRAKSMESFESGI